MAAQDIPTLIDELEAIHARSVENLRAALSAYIGRGVRPDPDGRALGRFAYPELRIAYDPDGAPAPVGRAFARVNRPGVYATSLTRPALFRDYLLEQLDLLVRDYGVEVSVGRSAQEIPFPYVLDAGLDSGLDGAASADLARFFPSTQLVQIGDEVADGSLILTPEQPRPLALFDALRTDYSLARLRHYTGTPAEHVQSYVLFTNYHRYVDEFVRWGAAQLREGGRYETLSCAGGVVIDADTADPERAAAEAPLASPPDAGLPPDRAGSRRADAGQHRGRSLQRQDHHRPPGGAASARLADDRPLRRGCGRPRRSATTCWPTPTCATTTCWTPCCRRKSPSRPSPRCRWRCSRPPRP